MIIMSKFVNLGFWDKRTLLFSGALLSMEEYYDPTILVISIELPDVDKFVTMSDN